MKKFMRGSFSNKGVLAFVTILNKLRKTLTVLGIVAMLWSYVPWQQIQAEVVPEEETIVEEIETAVDESFIPDYPTTTDYDFDPSLVDLDSEVVEERTESTKTFRKIDGTYEVAMYDEVVHYLNENNELQQVDNSLVDLGTELENKDNAFKVKFPKKLDDNKQIKLSMDGYSIDWNVLNITTSDVEYSNEEVIPSNMKELANITQDVLYRDIQHGVDLEYIISGSDVKENIKLDYYRTDFSLTFEYKLKDLDLVTLEPGEIVFMNEDNEVIFSFSDLYMYDYEMNVSTDIEFTIVDTGNKTYQITMTPSDEWLQNASYPVVVDPTVTYNALTDITFEETYVNESSPTTQYYNNYYMEVGDGAPGTSEIKHGLVQFTIPSNLMDKHISYAFYNLDSHTSIEDNIYIHENVQSFSAYSVYWNNRPSYGDVIDYVGANNQLDLFFDITKSVREWVYNGTSIVPGFTLRTDEDINKCYLLVTEEYVGTSYENPKLIIGYIDKEGVKDYWTYSSQNMEESGTGLISDYTGLLTIVRDDLSFSTDKQSLGFSMIYDINRYNDSSIYGDGWTTNYNMSLSTITDNQEYAITDGTGNTVHYYSTTCDSRMENDQYISSTCYIAEDGSGDVLVFKKVVGYLSDIYVLTMDQVSYSFGIGTELKKITDKKGQYVTINRDSTNQQKILSIVDKSGNKLNFKYYTNPLFEGYLEYVDLMIEKSGVYETIERVSYSYDGNGHLTRVKYHSNYDDTSLNTTHETFYGYDTSYRLDEVTSESALKTVYVYDASNRVSSVSKFINDTGVGEVTYQYDLQRTIITDHKGNFVIYHFDTYGHTTNILDSFGTTQHFKYMNPQTFNIGTPVQPEYTIVKNIGVNYNWNHKMISQSSPQITITNPLNNHSFEYSNYYSDTSWTFVSDSDDTYSGAYSDLYSVYGSKSLKIHNDEVGEKTHVEQTIYVKEGFDYLLSGFVHNQYNGDATLEVVANGNTYVSDVVTNQDEWLYSFVEFDVDDGDSNYDEVHSVTIKLVSDGLGTTYFDNIQVTNGYIDSEKNLIDNSSFEHADSTILDGWKDKDGNAISNVSIPSDYNVYDFVLENNAIMFNNTTGENKFVSYGLEDLNYDSTTNYNLVVGSWILIDETTPASMNSLTSTEDKNLRIRVDFMNLKVQAGATNYESAIIDSAYVDFDSLVEGAQYVFGEVRVPQGTVYINIGYEYSCVGTVYFDNLQVYEKPIFTKYQFRDDSNQKIKVASPSGEVTHMQYELVDNTPTSVRVTDANGGLQSTTNVDIDNQYLVNTLKTNNVTVDPIYNSEGQVTELRIGDETDYFSTSTYYNTYKNQFVSQTTNEFNDSTYFYYNDFTGLLNRVENPNGNVFEYEYNNDGSLKKVINPSYCDPNNPSDCASVSYEYESNRLSKIVLENGYYYHLQYDTYNRIEKVTVKNDNTLMSEDLTTYTYQSDDTYETSRIDTQTYASGDSLKFTYNDMEQIESVSFKGSNESVYAKSFSYLYDSRNRLAVTFTYKADGSVISEYYTYDDSNQITRISDSEGNEILYNYDDLGNLDQFIFNVDSGAHMIEYDHYEDIQLLDDLMSEGYYMDMDLDRQYGYILSYEAGTIFKVQDGKTSITTTTNGVDPSIGGFIQVEYNTQYEYEFQVPTLNGDCILSLIEYSVTEDDGMEFVNSSVRHAINTVTSNDETKIGTFTTSSSTNYILLVLTNETSTFSLEIDNFTLDNVSEDSVQRYDKTIYTTLDAELVVKDYIYKDEALQRLDMINLTNFTFSIDNTFFYSSKTNRINYFNYSIDEDSDGVPDSAIFYYYQYDDNGNIVYEREQDINYNTVFEKTYQYDSMNQLIREDNYDADVDCTSYSDTCFTAYYHYDLRGNITEKKYYPYGQNEILDVPLPEETRTQTGTTDIYVSISGATEINVGDSLSLSFTYYLADESLVPVPMTTNCTYSDVDTNAVGYYLLPCDADAKFGSTYGLDFEVLIKVGEPVGDPNIPAIKYSYTYDSDWLDQLVSVSKTENSNTTTIYNTSYDEMGNPNILYNFIYDDVTYHRAVLQYNGRQLMKIDLMNFNGSGFSTIRTISYTYNDQGYRTSKTVDGTTVEYLLSGDKVIRESQGSLYEITYSYDVDGTIISYNINVGPVNQEVFYVRNQLGDITKLVSEDGIVLVEYTYDAWGNIIDVYENDSYATLAARAHEYNRYFYRGYRYDSDTMFYYLNSRYYNPLIGRFINVDGLLGEQGNILGHNTYAYTHNNPVMYSDISGEFPVLITLIVIAYTAWTVVDLYKVYNGLLSFDQETGNLNNSDMVQNPSVIFGYSLYMKYSSKYKEYFQGSAGGIAAEWMWHNALFDGASALKKIGVDSLFGESISDIYDSAKTAGFGSSVFKDTIDNQSRPEVVYPSLIIEGLISPVSLVYDLYVEFARRD